MKSAFLLLPVLALAAVARAESPDSIPDPRATNRSSIYDGARVLSAAQKKRIDARVGEVKRTTGAQFTIVTVRTLDGMPIQEFANSVFRRIGIGQKGKDDGALFLFAIEDHKSWIEVGFGLEDRLTDARSGAIAREQIRPAFKNSDYGGGILSGIEVAANYVEGGTRPTPSPQLSPKVAPPISSGAPSSNGNGNGLSPNTNRFPSNNTFPSGSYSPTNVYPVTSAPSGSGGGLLLLGLLAAGGIGGLMYLGSRPRKCPRCKTDMRETEAPASELSPANQCEQAIGSRRFLHFGCPKCGFFQIEPHTNAFSHFTHCAACRNLTAQRTARVLQQPTYTYAGIQETTEQCLLPPCRHVSRHQRTLPRLQRSSSGVVIIGGGLGGFGGGLGGGMGNGSGDSGGGFDGGSYDGGLTDVSGGGDSGGGGGGADW